jgi:CRP-like cAMP-binding protein
MKPLPLQLNYLNSSHAPIGTLRAPERTFRGRLQLLSPDTIHREARLKSRPRLAGQWRLHFEDWKEALHLEHESPERYEAGAMLFRQGSRLPAVWLIVSGFVKLTALDPLDGTDRSKCWRTSGELLGNVQAILGSPSPVTATAAGACLAYRIPATRFLETLGYNRESPQWVMLQARCQEYSRLFRTRCLTTSRHARLRLEYVLSELVNQQHGPNVDHEVALIDYSPGNKELAGYIGVNITYIPTLLGQLQAAGIAQRQSGVLIVSKPKSLAHLPWDASSGRARAERWKQFFSLGRPRVFEPGYTLLREHEAPDDVYLIEDGFVDVSTTGGDLGNASVNRPLNWCHSGDLVGDACGMLQTAHTVTARTKTTCLLHHVAAERLVEILNPGNNRALATLIAAQTADVVELTDELAVARTSPLRSRLENVLWRLGRDHHGQADDAGSTEVRLDCYSPSNAELAGFAGTEERYVCQIMQFLKAEKLVWRGASRLITISGLERLRASAAAAQ